MATTADLPPTSPDLPPGEVAKPAGTTSPHPVPPVGDGGRSRPMRNPDRSDLVSTSPWGRSQLPAWLAAKLADDNPDGITRGARLLACPRCGARTLRGLDDDRCAIAVTVTPLELDHFGEYLALARGLRTFHLARRANPSGTARWELDPRYPATIENPRRRYPVIPEHSCHIWLPAAQHGLLARMKPPPSGHGDNPPF